MFAINTSGSSSQQLSTPNWAIPSMQVPGRPHSLQALPGMPQGTIDVSWQRPRVPAHSISCFNDGPTVKDCPTPYGGSLPASDGGEVISEYELEFNERSDFLGSDGGRRTSIRASQTVRRQCCQGRQMGREYMPIVPPRVATFLRLQ